MSRETRKPERHALHRHASTFAALGDRTRLALMHRLCAGAPLSISRLTEGSSLTRQAVTKHLRVLSAAGLVRRVRRGRETLFHAHPGPLDEARRALDRIARQWDEALERLRALVEE